MPLKDQLAADLRDAMRAGDEVRKLTIRGALAAIASAEDAAVKKALAGLNLDAGLSPAQQDAVDRARAFSDDEVLAVLQRQVKQRGDSIEEFRKAGREELAAKEAAEMAVLQTYLPQQLSREEVEAAARAVIAETGAAGPSDKGKVMPVLLKRLAGRADGRTVNGVVSELLNS